MKILFLTPWYPDERNPNHGIFIRDQVKAVNALHDVLVISAKIDYTSFGFYSFRTEKSQHNGFVEYRIMMKRSVPVLNQLIFFLLVARETIRIAKQFPPDIIHGNIGYPGACWSWIVSRVTGAPYIVSEHTRVQNNFRSFFHRILTVQFLRRACAIISVSQQSAGEIFSVTGKKPIVIPNIVNLEKFNEIHLNETSVCQIGFLGGLSTNVKGLDILLRACAGIQADFILHIGGTGKLLEQYKQLAKELQIDTKCKFYGFVPHDQVSAFLRQLHFFVSASRYESFGVAMIEAMACGLPVIATNCNGPLDFINPQNGILVSIENVEALRIEIEYMIKHYQRFDRHVIRKFAITHYSAQQFREHIQSVYNKVHQGAMG